MEEIRNVYDLLARLGHKQAEIDHAVDRVAAAHDDLSARQAEFGPLMEQAEKLMAANPRVEAIECGSDAHVLVRLPSGAVTILPLTHWSELDLPESTRCNGRDGGGCHSLSAAQADSMGFDHRLAEPLSPDEHERIQDGKPTPADLAKMAKLHACDEFQRELIEAWDAEDGEVR